MSSVITKIVSGLFLLVLVGLWACSGPGELGDKCKRTADCEEGLFCRFGKCWKARQETVPPEEKEREKPGQEEAPGDGGAPEGEKPPEGGREDPPEQVEEKKPDLPGETLPEREPAGEVGPEPLPEASPEGSSTRTLYELLDPISSQKGKQGETLQIKKVVVTTPAVRLSASLRIFFVQETAPRNKSYRYGGLAVVYNPTQFPNLAPLPGNLVDVQGVFYTYYSTGKNCTQDSDCAGEKYYPLCRDIYLSSSGTTEKRCAAVQGLPQLLLQAAPTNRGSHPLPEAVVVDPADVRTGGKEAQAYRGVVVKVEQVKVVSANPDDPKDFGEFSVAKASAPSGDLRIDDLINTVRYTGSRYCRCNKGVGDESYCLAGDTCHCSGGSSAGSCYLGSAAPDKRKVGDTFRAITGVLYFSFGDSKLAPRLPTDLQF